MGVVRREGDWRLHKRDEGIYEITHSERVEMKIITSDYSPDTFHDERTDFTVPVREVESFSEAESLFQDVAQNSQSVGGMGSPVSSDIGPVDVGLPESQRDDESADLPPVGILVVALVGGGFAISQTGFAFGSPVFLFGVGLVVVALAVVGLAGLKYSAEGLDAAIEFLFSTGDDGSRETEDNDSDETETTPPAPKNLKNELYFERADQQCEWCDKRIDSPDVHHIVPRSEGGPNEPENLIVLCPNCHRKADRGAISRSKLRYAISEEQTA